MIVILIVEFKTKSRITTAEATVVLKLNQGTTPKKGCNLFRVSFFGSFLDKQKRTIIILILFLMQIDFV